MAIDFSRAFRGIATGALGAATDAMEQKDRMYAEIAVSAGKNYLENILPQSIEAEKRRKENYNRIFSLTGDRNFTELMDRDGFTTLNDGVTQATELYKNVDKEKLKAATFETSYEDRYNQRQKSQREKYDPILKQLGFGIGNMGPNTIKSQIEEDFVTGKDTQPAKQPTGTADMTQQTPVDFSSSTISDFIIQPQISYDIPESEFQKVASTMRGFGQFFTQDQTTGELKVNLNDTNRNEYGALRNISQELAQNYLDQDGNVNVSAAMTAASNMLTKQTSNMIYGEQLADKYEQGIASRDGTSFSENFNKEFKTDAEKKQYLANGLFNLDGGKDAQRFFAQSFPEKVQFNDGTRVRDYLLRLTGLLR
tara:strand:- start:769 stop:1866 length:1098 start_codon:yes stop_codon:yes gene_type:complete